MKYLILLLLTFNAYAEFKVEFIETSTGGTYQFEKPDEEKAKKHLLKIIKKSQWMKGEFNNEVSDLSETYKDMEGNGVTRYYHPSNFTYTLTDITQELADKAAQKAIDDARKDELKVKDKNMKLNELIELLKLKGVI
jgi:hypothetical protein